MKRLTTTLGILILALGACGGGLPAQAQARCNTGSSGVTICWDPRSATYFGTTSVGTFQGQCSSGAKWDSAVPFMVVNSVHRILCEVELQYVR